MIGDTFPSEKVQFKDPETGAEITQYTREGRTNRTLYFTNRPYVCGGEQIVFLSDRTGRNEMFLLHLKSGKITQLTDEEGHANVSNCVHPTRPELYFRAGKTICRVSLDTLKTEELLRAPDGFNFGILNLNAPPWLVFDMGEEIPHGVTKLRGRAPDAAPSAPSLIERLHLRPRTMICRYNVDDDIFEPVWGDHRLLTHVQSSPTDPNLLVYSDWAGYGADRCYYLDLSKRVKNPPRPTFPESVNARANHECFTRQGTLYAQWMEGDLERDGEHTLHHAFLKIGGVPAGQIDSVRHAKFEKYEVGEKSKDLVHHFTMSFDETWGVHDRWPIAPTLEENMSWLSIFRNQKRRPQTVYKKVCFHNGHQGDRMVLGAELTLDDRDAMATYTSFLGGSANVCQVDVRPFVDALMKENR